MDAAASWGPDAVLVSGNQLSEAHILDAEAVERDCDLEAGPLFALLVLTDLQVKRVVLETYATTVSSSSACPGPERASAFAVSARLQQVERMIPADHQDKRDELWFDILALTRRTHRPDLAR